MSALRLSRPGQPVVLIPDDPYGRLTRRQRDILQAVRSTNGNRARAARHLGISTTAVQAAMRLCAKHGAPVPAPLPSRRGQPNLHPMPVRPTTPRCGFPMRYKHEPCARRAGHTPGHRTAASLAADRRGRVA